jgi:hypothetical protein
MKKLFCLTKTKEIIMEFLKKIGSWAKSLTEIGISIIALGVVLEVLFKGMQRFLSGQITQ